MTPNQFLQMIVRPNVTDFQAHLDDLRFAFNAVASVDALVAHLYSWCKQNAPAETKGGSEDSYYRNHLAHQSSEFSLLRDIAKANKHVHLTRGCPRVSSAHQVNRRELGWDEGLWEEVYWDVRQQVVVDVNSGQTRSVNAIVNNALSFLEGEMKRVGAL